MIARLATLSVLCCCCFVAVAVVADPPGRGDHRDAERKVSPLARTQSAPAGATLSHPFDAHRAAFSVRAGEELIPYRIFATFVLPGSELELQVPGAISSAGYHLVAAAGAVDSEAPGRWTWRAPSEPGLYPLDITRQDGESLRLNAFVLVPLSEARDGHLRGYRVGHYPSEPLRGLSTYLPPPGFVLVTPEIAATPVSPHFSLQQFLCKQQTGFPALVALRERLLLKLEYLLEQVNERGYRCDTFAVLSGFRTPYYNHAIGNVKYSRHQWGGAADIYIDVAPADGMMDDLDGNGIIDHGDADILYDLIDGQVGGKEYEPFIGGLGRYGKTANHGPFVHVDARGFQARWGR